MLTWHLKAQVRLGISLPGRHLEEEIKMTTETYIRQIDTEAALSTKDLAVYYGEKQAFSRGTISFPRNQISALIGPSGCGKSTFLRSLNRMNDDIARVEGQIMYRNLDINNDKINIYELRTKDHLQLQRHVYPKIKK